MSDTEKLEQIARILEQIRDYQRVQLERQAESLSIQKEQFQALLQQREKTAQMQERQKVQLDRQAESLSIQKEQFQALLQQREKTTQMQERAEAIQERSARLVRVIQRFVPAALVVVVILIAFVTWLLWRSVR